MAMLQVGMGDVGTPTVPGKLDELVGGAKIWLSPSQVPAALSNLGAGWAASPLSVVGFLAVPALALLLLWGMGAAKRRRSKNPRRRRVAVRRVRRRANPRRRRNTGPRYKLGKNAGRRRTARRRAGGGVGYYTKPGSMAAAKVVRRWKSSKAGKRSRSRGTHKNPGTVPGIAKWSTFYGGTAAAEGKSGYDLRVGGQTYTIQPYTTKHGRHAGYSLTAYPGDPPRGHQQLGSFRSPQAAASAARKFHGTIRHDSHGILL